MQYRVVGRYRLLVLCYLHQELHKDLAYVNITEEGEGSSFIPGLLSGRTKFAADPISRPLLGLKYYLQGWRGGGVYAACVYVLATLLDLIRTGAQATN